MLRPVSVEKVSESLKPLFGFNYESIQSDPRSYRIIFSSEDEAKKALQELSESANFLQIDQYFEKFDASRIKLDNNGKYSISLNKANLSSLRQHFRKKAPTLTPKGDFVFKGLRLDERCFYRKFIEMVGPKNKKHPLRKGLHKPVTVVGTKNYGIKRRRNFKPNDPRQALPLKSPQYTADQKKGFSQAQSASLSTNGFYPNVFGFATGRSAKLVTMIFEEKDVLYSEREYVYDGGTVRRPYNFYNIKDAKQYFKEKVLRINRHQRTKKSRILFSANDIDAFKKAIAKPKNKDGYNEVLARLRFAPDTCKITIATDNLNTRLAAKECARVMQDYLIKQCGYPKDFIIPICFYTPDNPELHFSEYTREEQALDSLEANSILFDQKEKYTQYNENNYEFLLELSPSKLIEELVRVRGSSGRPVLLEILKNGYISMFQSLEDKIGHDEMYSILEEIFKQQNIKSKKTTEDVYPALYYAFMHDNTTLVNFILKNFDLKQLNSHQTIDHNILNLAIEKDDANFINLLLEDKNISSNLNLDLALHNAVELGNVNLVKMILATGAKNIKIDSLLTSEYIKTAGSALLKAAYYDQSEITKLLLNAGANPGAYTSFADSPIVMAAKHGNHDVFMLLLKSDYGVNLTDKELGVLINTSISHNYIHILAEIIEIISKTGRINFKRDTLDNVIYYLIKKGDISSVELLLAKGITLDRQQQFGFDVLTELTKNVDLNKFNTIVDAAASRYKLDNSDVKKILSAVKKGEIPTSANPDNTDNNLLMIKLAIALGVDVDSAIHSAVESKNWEAVMLLLDAGADPNGEVEDEDRKKTITLLAKCAQAGRVDVVARLLKAGADLKEEGNNLLTESSKRGYVDIVNLLLEHGVNPNQPDKQNLTPLLASVTANEYEIVKALLKAGAEPNVENYPGEDFILKDVPLLASIRNMNLMLTKDLLTAGANLNVQVVVHWKTSPSKLSGVTSEIQDSITPFCRAILIPDYDIAKKMVQLLLDVESLDFSKQSSQFLYETLVRLAKTTDVKRAEMKLENPITAEERVAKFSKKGSKPIILSPIDLAELFGDKEMLEMIKLAKKEHLNNEDKRKSCLVYIMKELKSAPVKTNTSLFSFVNSFSSSSSTTENLISKLIKDALSSGNTLTSKSYEKITGEILEILSKEIFNADENNLRRNEFYQSFLSTFNDVIRKGPPEVVEFKPSHKK